MVDLKQPSQAFLKLCSKPLLTLSKGFLWFPDPEPQHCFFLDLIRRVCIICPSLVSFTNLHFWIIWSVRSRQIGHQIPSTRFILRFDRVKSWMWTSTASTDLFFRMSFILVKRKSFDSRRELYFSCTFAKMPNLINFFFQKVGKFIFFRGGRN